MKHRPTHIIVLLLAAAVCAIFIDGIVDKATPDEALTLYEEDRRRRLVTLERVHASEDSVVSHAGRNRTLFARRARLRAALVAARPPVVPQYPAYREMVRVDDRLLADVYAEVALRKVLATDYRRLVKQYEEEARTRAAATRACRQSLRRTRVRRTLTTVAVTAGITFLLIEA